MKLSFNSIEQMKTQSLLLSRAFYIAVSFIQQKRFKESAALVNKSEIYMEQAKKTVSDGQKPKTSDLDYQVEKCVVFEEEKFRHRF